MDQEKKKDSRVLTVQTGEEAARLIKSWCALTGSSPGALLRRAFVRGDYRDAVILRYEDLFMLSARLGRLNELLGGLLISAADLTFLYEKELYALSGHKEAISELSGKLTGRVLDKRKQLRSDCIRILKEEEKKDPSAGRALSAGRGAARFYVCLSQREHEELTEDARRTGETKRALVLQSLGRLFRFGCFVIESDEMSSLCPGLDIPIERAASLLERLTRDRADAPLPRDFACLFTDLQRAGELLSLALQTAGKERPPRAELKLRILSGSPEQVTCFR